MKNFPRETLEERTAKLALNFQIIRAESATKTPLAILIHGCGKADGPQLQYVESLAKIGISSLIIDSFAPRDISRFESQSFVCTGMTLWGRERAGDLMAAIHYANGLDFVDNSQIFAIGFSHGGWTIMEALCLDEEIARHAMITPNPKDIFANIKGVFLVYPYCGVGAHSMLKGWQIHPKAHMIIAGHDAVVGSMLPRQTVKRLQTKGEDIDFTLFPKATHAFDELDGMHPLHRYDAGIAAQSVQICTEFFETLLPKQG